MRFISGESIDQHKITDDGAYISKQDGGDDEDEDDESSGRGVSSSILEKSNVEDGMTCKHFFLIIVPFIILSFRLLETIATSKHICSKD